jgi:mutator protein MutT
MVKKVNIGTAGIIRKNNKILIAQRKKDSWMEPNKWEFPGGRIELNETYEECLIREIREELGIIISIDRLFMKTTHTYIKNNEEFPVTLMVYLADWMSGDVKNIDCQASKWVDAIQIPNFDFADADIPIINKLLNYLK